jgi:hypothetical protein
MAVENRDRFGPSIDRRQDRPFYSLIPRYPHRASPNYRAGGLVRGHEADIKHELLREDQLKLRNHRPGANGRRTLRVVRTPVPTRCKTTCSCQSERSCPDLRQPGPSSGLANLPASSPQSSRCSADTGPIRIARPTNHRDDRVLRNEQRFGAQRFDGPGDKSRTGGFMGYVQESKSASDPGPD